MIAVVIEPALLAVPPVANSEAEVEDIIDRLSAWSGCLLNGSILRVAQMSDTTEVLGLTNCWPTGPNVTSLLEMYGLENVYSPTEVTRLINTILERSIPVLSLVGFEVTECIPDPGRPAVAYQAPQLEQAGQNAFATLAAGLSKGIFLAPANHLPGSHIFFKGEVQNIERAEDYNGNLVPPFSVFGSINIARGPNCVCDALDCGSVWHAAKTSEDIHLSILLKMADIQREGGHPTRLEGLPAFAVGSEFFESLRRNKAGPKSQYGDNVLETCARLVLGRPKSSADRFMKGARSRNQEQWQRDRDGMMAYRTHVTKKGEGLRLVFWQAGRGGLIEFANVAMHEDLSLCEGEKDKTVFRSW
jgi:hypothetical protein